MLTLTNLPLRLLVLRANRFCFPSLCGTICSASQTIRRTIMVAGRSV
jgi:hypothetical protein